MPRAEAVLGMLLLTYLGVEIATRWCRGITGKPAAQELGTTEDLMQYHETTWTSARGGEAVRTVRQQDETAEAWQSRHNAAVAAAQAVNPKVI